MRSTPVSSVVLWANERRRLAIRATRGRAFLEVSLSDTSEFSAELNVVGDRRHGYRVLKVDSPAVANTVAAILLAIRDTCGKVPHVYLNWTEGNPVVHLLQFLIFGVGEIAPVTREVLRRAEPDLSRRPVVHVA